MNDTEILKDYLQGHFQDMDMAEQDSLLGFNGCCM